MRIKHGTKCAIVFIILILALMKNCFAAETVLEQYVKAPDSAFQYELVKTAYNILYTTYIFENTSQAWHSDAVVPDKWKHWLTIVEPRLLGEYTEYIPFFSLVRSDKALLYLLRGDAEHEDRPSGASSQAVELALSTRSIIAEIHGIPVGPVAFLDEQPDKYGSWWCDEDNPLKLNDDECELLRIEDSLQARSFDLALSTEDFTWALMAPMTKAVVRGMDVIQEFIRQRYLGLRTVRSFVLTGHSKRGYVTWLAAALDDRVAGVAPVSYDLINMPEQFALEDISWPARSPDDANLEFDLYDRLKTEVGVQLIADVDLYAYRERLDIPAMIQVGTADPYSCPDSVNIYLKDLPGDTRISYLPNAGHDIRELPEVENGIAVFYRHILNNRAMPEFTWDGLESGSFTVTPVEQKPVAVKLWAATNPANRDFRETAGIQWTATDVAAELSGSYTGTVLKPEAGYTAYYIELTYKDIEGEASYTLATPVTMLSR